MRKIIVLAFITIDGVMQAPGGPEEDASGGFRHGGWTVPYFDESLGKIMSEQMKQPFDLLLGRKTFEIFASYWPHHEADWPGINDVTKYVVTTTLDNYDWKNVVFIKSNFVEEIKKLKAQNGFYLQVYGSSRLIQMLLQHDLVDQLWIKIFPIALGTGKRLFFEGTIPASFRLIYGKILPTGVIIANYERFGDVKTGTFS